MIYKTWTDADNDGAIWNEAIYMVRAADNEELSQEAITLSGGNDALAAQVDLSNTASLSFKAFYTEEGEAVAEFKRLAADMIKPVSFRSHGVKFYSYSAVVLERLDIEYGEIIDSELIDMAYQVSD